MAITTIDQLLAAFQPPRAYSKSPSGTMVSGRHHSFWGFAGYPGAGSFDTTLNGVNLDSTSALVAGQIPFVQPGGGQSAYAARFTGNMASVNGVMYLADRIWHNGNINITSTGSQSITTPTLPARDATGTTNGVGYLMALEVSAQTGSGTPTITVGYTNQAGTASRTATNIRPTAATSIAGTFHPLTLQAGDTGVQSIQSLTLSSSWTSGTVNLCIYRILAQIEIASAGAGAVVDPITGGLPQMFTGSVPFVFVLPSSSSSTTVNGQFIQANG
jgi:hypothetical protein